MPWSWFQEHGRNPEAKPTATTEVRSYGWDEIDRSSRHLEEANTFSFQLYFNLFSNLHWQTEQENSWQRRNVVCRAPTAQNCNTYLITVTMDLTTLNLKAREYQKDLLEEANGAIISVYTLMKRGHFWCPPYICMNLNNHHNKAFLSIGLSINAINSAICLYKVENKVEHPEFS